MPKLLENKQLIHIVSELVILLGITFYFSRKIKKLSSQIEDLALKIEEQDDIIQKHEQIIRSLVEYVNNQQHMPSSMQNSYISEKKPPKAGENLEQRRIQELKGKSYSQGQSFQNNQGVYQETLDPNQSSDHTHFSQHSSSSRYPPSNSDQVQKYLKSQKSEMDKLSDISEETIPVEKLDEELTSELNELDNTTDNNNVDLKLDRESEKQ